MTKQEKEQEIKEALETLKPFRGRYILAITNPSRTGNSRHIELFSTKKDDDYIYRIGYSISVIIGAPYDFNRGGIFTKSYAFDILYNFNLTIMKLEGIDPFGKNRSHNDNCKYFSNCNV